MRPCFFAPTSFAHAWLCLGVLLGAALVGCGDTHSRADDAGPGTMPALPDAAAPMAPDAAAAPTDCIEPLEIARGRDVHAAGIAWNEDRFLVAWVARPETGERGMAQVLDARGAPLGPPREVPSIWGGALAVGRGFVIFVEAGVQRLSMDGELIGGPIPIGETFHGASDAAYVEGSRLLVRASSFGGEQVLAQLDVIERDPSVEIVREVPSEWMTLGVAADRTLELRRHAPFVLREVPLGAGAEPPSHWESTWPEQVAPLSAAYDATRGTWEVMVERHIVEEGFGSYSAPGAILIDGSGMLATRQPVEGRPLRTVTGTVARTDAQTALAYWDFHSDALLWVLDHDARAPAMPLPLDGLATTPVIEVDRAHGGFAVLASRGEPHTPHQVVELRCGLGAAR